MHTPTGMALCNVQNGDGGESSSAVAVISVSPERASAGTSSKIVSPREFVILIEPPADVISSLLVGVTNDRTRKTAICAREMASSGQ